MAMSYSYDLQAKVFDRMTALEAQAEAMARFNLPKTYSEAMRLAADQADQIEAQQAQLAIAQRVSDETELGGSTIPQWLPLYKVHSGHANTVAELARKCTVDAGAMTRLLDRLESKGLCRRVRSETDRRVVQIELTPEGEEVAQRVPLALSRVYNAALADFSHEEWQQLRGFLLRLRANAERGAAQASQDQA